jgi:DNA-binding MarR family transcriptional regulator
MRQEVVNLIELDRVIHEPGRLVIVSLLFSVAQADFLYLLNETGLNKGTLSSHLARLEQERYLEIIKTFRGKVPQTLLRLTAEGRKAFDRYRRTLKASL